MPLLLVTGLLVAAPVGTAQGAPEAAQAGPKPKFSSAVAFDTSPAMRDVARQATAARRATGNLNRPERGPASAGRGFGGDAEVQSSTGASPASVDIPSPTVNFEGVRGTDNIPVLGGIPIPPDPDGDVGPNHYVQMGRLPGAGLRGQQRRPDRAARPDRRPLHPDAVHHHRAELLQLRGRLDHRDPTGSYFRYAFSTGVNFPDYPKYGVWPNAYFLTTREFAPTTASPASACTRWSGARCSTATRPPAPCRS